MTKPTLLFVHGAWHGAWAWDRLREICESEGWKTVAVDLPSADGNLNPEAGLFDDARVIQEAAKLEDGPVIVIAHSYGGAPTSQAEFGSQVTQIIFIASFALDVGESLLKTVGGVTPSWWVRRGDKVLAGTLEEPATEKFYGDVAAERAQELASRLTAHNARAFEQELTHASWSTIPVGYVIAEDDQAIPSFAQEAMALRAAGTNVARMPTSHSPFESQPAKLWNSIQRLISVAG